MAVSAANLILPQPRASLDGYAVLFAGAVSSLVALVTAPAVSLIRTPGDTSNGNWSASAWQKQFTQDELHPEALTIWSHATAAGHRPADEAKPTPSVILRSASQLRAERLAAIQSSLGVPIQDLAKLLNISRPQLYKWLDASKALQMQAASRQRLDQVEELAEHWRSLSPQPLWPLLRNGHEPLLESLYIAQPDIAVIKGRMTETAQRLSQAPKSRSQLLREAGFTARPSSRALPSDA